MAGILDTVYSTRAKDKLTGGIVRVLRSSLGDDYVYDIDTHKVYRLEELEFGTTELRLYSYEEAHGGVMGCIYDDLPF